MTENQPSLHSSSPDPKAKRKDQSFVVPKYSTCIWYPILSVTFCPNIQSIFDFPFHGNRDSWAKLRTFYCTEEGSTGDPRRLNSKIRALSSTFHKLQHDMKCSAGIAVFRAINVFSGLVWNNLETNWYCVYWQWMLTKEVETICSPYRLRFIIARFAPVRFLATI